MKNIKYLNSEFRSGLDHKYLQLYTSKRYLIIHALLQLKGVQTIFCWQVFVVNSSVMDDYQTQVLFLNSIMNINTAKDRYFSCFALGFLSLSAIEKLF